MTNKRIKVIFDTNVWISFLIGKTLKSLKNYISDKTITIVTTDQLFIEIRIVSSREKLQKYFPKNKVDELIELLELVGENYRIVPTHFINRDPKDNFLLDLIDFSKADYLVTGDKDLLDMKNFKKAKILTPKDFENLLINL